MLLNIYKPKGMTSFDVVAKVRKHFNIKKVGHAGTLDPLAEGVIIVLTEKDTKKQDELMGQEKEYIADILFGATSPSFDLETELRFTGTPIDINELKVKIENSLLSFIGEIDQRVPAFSAVKVGGKRLYKGARQGIINEETLPIRKVNVKSISLESFETDSKYQLPVAKIKIVTGSGFYVRSFAQDLGAMVGTGAVLTGLVRSRVGEFTSSESKDITSFLTSM